MPPIDRKKSWKDVNRERKEIRKKWNEKKLLKKLGLKKNIDELDNLDVVNSEINCLNNLASHDGGDGTLTTNEYGKISKDNINDCVINNAVISENEQITNNKELCTISIAVPGSILENAQSTELRTYVAGQIARAACIYNVDEIIVFNDKGEGNDNKAKILVEKNKNRACLQFARILQFLECPQYLRKHIFPMHKHLEYAGLLNPLDAPHHLRQRDDFPYREGIISEAPIKKGQGSYVNVGLLKDVKIDKILTPKLRVTVKILPPKKDSKKQYGVVVAPSQPKLDLNIYWGYTVRLADSLSEIFINGPYKDGYDLTIGTSDKGTSIDQIIKDKNIKNKLKNFKHCLIVFGGVDGLETALECDDNLDTTDVSLLFDLYINTCPKQGLRTIRTEEAVLISLSELRRLLLRYSC